MRNGSKCDLKSLKVESDKAKETESDCVVFQHALPRLERNENCRHAATTPDHTSWSQRSGRRYTVFCVHQQIPQVAQIGSCSWLLQPTTTLCSMNTSGEENDTNLGFPGKLYEILDTSTTRGMEWTAGGDAICVFPQRFNEFESKQHFQGTLYGSFTRRLYRYGFDRLVVSCKADYPSGAHVYRNDLFRRDRPDLVRQMKVDNKRLYRKAIRQKRAAEPENESESERPPFEETLSPEKGIAPQIQEVAPSTTDSVTDLLRQDLAVRMQNQLNGLLRTVDNGLNPFLMAALSHARNSSDPTAMQSKTASAASSPAANSSQDPSAIPGLNNADPPSFVDSRILELLRLQYRR